MIGRLFGPCDGRRHVVTLARFSGLNTVLKQMHDQLLIMHGIHYVTYGDPAYVDMLCPWLTVGYLGAHLTLAQQNFNSAMYGVRVSVEWLFGDVL